MSKLIAIGVLGALLLAILLTGCADEQHPTSEPTRTSAPAPISASTSGPKSLIPSPAGGPTSTFNIDADSEWQEVFDSINAREQSCIRDELDQESLGHALGSSVIIEGYAEQWHISIFRCLDSETAEALFISILKADEVLDEEAAICVRGLLNGIDVAEVLAADLPDSSPESLALAGEFYDIIMNCLEKYVPSPTAGGKASGPPPPDGALLWQYGTSNPGELIIVSPSVVDGVVYAGSYEGSVYALNAKTGELLWRFDAGDGLNPPPKASGEVLYAEKERGGFHALDASTGELLSSDESLYDELLLSDGTIYFSTWRIDGDFSVHIRAVDAESGEEMWTADVPRSSELPLLFPVTASDEMVFVSDENQVHALDSATGEPAWSFESGVADGGIVQDPPAASDGMVYLRSYSAAYALEESTGRQLWKYNIGYDFWGRPPFIVDGVWTLVELEVLHGLDTATGRLLWSFEEDRVSFVSGVAEGTVFVTGVGAFHALDAATGKELWSLDADWHIGEVEVVDGVLYANSLDGYLHALDAWTGEPLWSIEIGYHLGGTGKPYVILGGVVYVGYQLRGSGIYAFTAPIGR